MPITHTTPLGTLTLAATENGLSYCAFDDGPRAVEITPGRSGDVADPVAARGWLELARRELDAYFAGELRGFSVPVDLRAILEPERRVLHLLSHVGYGRTTTYGAVALTAGLGPRGARSVGGAMARNPVLVVVAGARGERLARRLRRGVTPQAGPARPRGPRHRRDPADPRRLRAPGVRPAQAVVTPMRCPTAKVTATARAPRAS